MKSATFVVRGLVVATALLLTGCGGGEDESSSNGPVKERAEASLVPSKPATKPDRRSKSEPAELPPLAAERGPFLSKLPKDTLFVARLPNPAKSIEAVEASALWTAFGQLRSLQNQLAPFLRQGQDWMAESLPFDWRAVLAEVAGDVVIAVPSVHANPFGAEDRQGLPFTLVVHAELDGNPQHLSAAIEQAERAFGGVPRFDAKVPEGSRRVVFERKGTRLDLLLDARSLTILVAPSNFSLTPMDLRSLPAEESFLASEVVRGTPEPARGTTVGEVWMNLAPVWGLVRNAVPDEVRVVLDGLGMDHLEGISVLSSLEEGLFTERFQLHSSGGDLFSQLFADAELDPSFVRWLPSESENAALLALDLSRALQVVQNAMTPDARRTFHQSMTSLDTLSGLPLHKDVIENLGPQFALWTTGATLSEEISAQFGFALAVQVPRADAFKKVLGQIVTNSGMGSMQRAHESGKQKFHSVPLPPLPGAPPALAAFLEPSYAVVDDTFVLASNPDAMRRTLAAADSKGKAAPPALLSLLEQKSGRLLSVSKTDTGAQVRGFLDAAEKALQQAPEFPVAVQLPSDAEWNTFADALPDGASSMRQEGRGLVVESRSPLSLLLGGVVIGGGAITASVLVPNIRKARTEAQEGSVRSVLERIAEVQRTVKSGAYIDTDGDGVGEYAYFGEMTGAVPIRGGAARIGRSPLPAEFESLDQGVVRYAGHLFRLDLPDRAGRPCPERVGGGAPRNADSDGAESGYVVYCWPEQVGSTGQRVFVLDETGEIYVSDNDRPEQTYSGLERTPKGDAAFLETDNNRSRGTRSVRRGRDGGLWLKEEG